MASTRWTLNGKKSYASGSWSGWSGMSGEDMIQNRSSAQYGHAVIYRSASAGSGAYFTAADLTVCIHLSQGVEPIQYVDGTLYCEVYSSDPATGGDYIDGDYEDLRVYLSEDWITFSFDDLGMYAGTLYFKVWFDMEQDVVVYVNSNASNAILEVDREVPPTYYTVTVIGDDGCTVSGGGSVQEGGDVTVSAVIKPGYTFDGWYDEDMELQTDETSFTIEGVTSNMTLYAKTTQNIYYIRITPGEGIDETTGAGENYHYGDTVTISAAVESPSGGIGYKFDAWYSNEEHTEVYMVSKTFSVEITESIDLYPVAIAVTEFIVTISGEDGIGSVSGGGAVPVGEETTISCTLLTEDYIFESWKIGNDVFTTEMEYTFTPTDDMDILACVKKCMFNVIPVQYVTGTSGSGILPIGKTVTITATLATSTEHFIDFDGWYLCSGGEPYGDRISDRLTIEFKVPDEVFFQIGAVGRIVSDPFVYIYKDGEWHEYIPYVFKDHEWKKAWQYTNKNDNWMISV